MLFLLLLLPQWTFAQYRAKSFMMEDDRQGKGLQVGLSAQKDTTISFSTPTEISELYISGRAFLKDENHGFIRVTLKDDYNSDYLIYEVYPILADSTIIRLQKIGMETKVLDNLSPQSIRIEVSDATFQLDSVYYVKGTSKSSKSYTTRFAQTQDEQCQYIVDRLNDNLARRHMLWRAGMTSVAKRTYEEKKSMFGGKVPNLEGAEYYKGGIFSTCENALNSVEASIANSSSQYINYLSWTERHGKNWLTPVKDQGACYSCWIFSAIGATEAYINLYYNQLLGYNLSEQEIMSCNTLGYRCNDAGPINYALEYIEDNGVVTEDCFSYTATDLPCSNKCRYPSERIMLLGSNSTNVFPSDAFLKQTLQKAPVAIGIVAWQHAVVLIGYKIVEPGDTVYINHDQYFVVPSGSPYVGKTAWQIKNSWGTSWGNQGIAFYLNDAAGNGLQSCTIVNGGIYSLIHSDYDIMVTDSDGDGYYFWGVGPKPSHCPSWVPDTPDGDDSDYSKGPMDAYGYLQETADLLNDTIFITSDTTWNQQRFLYSHVVVKNNATLTVTDSVTFYQDVTMTLQGGGKLNLNGGRLLNAVVKTNTNNASAITISNNGTIELRQNQDFSLPLGNTMQINMGGTMLINSGATQ